MCIKWSTHCIDVPCLMNSHPPYGLASFIDFPPIVWTCLVNTAGADGRGMKGGGRGRIHINHPSPVECTWIFFAPDGEPSAAIHGSQSFYAPTSGVRPW